MKDSSVPVVVLSAKQDDVELVNQALREAGHRAQCHWDTCAENLDDVLAARDPHLIVHFADTLDIPTRQIASVRQRHSAIIPLLIIRDSVDENAIAQALAAGAQDMISASQRERLKAVATRELRTYRLERALDRTLQSASAYKAQLKSFMAGSIDAIAEVQEGIVVESNQAWADLLGHPSPDTTHGPIMDFIDAGSQAALKGALLAKMKGKWDGTALKVAAIRHEGGTVAVEISLEQSLFDGETSIKLAVQRPATVVEEPESIVERSIRVDRATGFSNRGYFIEQLTDALERSAGSGSRALALIRIDRFREIQDDIGPLASEEVVSQVAEIIRGLLGKTDTVGRFAGTTFAVILDRGALRDIQAWAEHVVSRIADAILEIDGKTLATTCTIGIAEIGPDTELVEPLIRTAEQSVQQGRKAGGDRVYLEESSDESTQIRRFDALWVHQIKSALVDGRFRLVHLGIATLSGPAMKMHDTVLRMIDQQGDEVAAGKFMESARRNGLARPIDRWVAAASITYCASHPCDLLFVKLTEDSIGDDDLVNWIAKQCREKGVDPGRLCIQVSEADATQHLKKTQVLSTRLREAKFRFAIEHFGVGRDPVRLLNQVPVDFVKIDGSLMQSVAADSPLQDRIKAYVTVARHMKAATIAERVDDANTMAVLFQLGISYIQGHYVHEPEVVLGESA